jgi:hypothetical protein
VGAGERAVAAKTTCAGTRVAALSAIVLAVAAPASKVTATTATAKLTGSAATQPAADGPSRRSISAAAAMTAGARRSETKITPRSIGLTTVRQALSDTARSVAAHRRDLEVLS